jgi:hypothetical protein
MPHQQLSLLGVPTRFKSGSVDFAFRLARFNVLLARFPANFACCSASAGCVPAFELLGTLFAL